MNVLRSARHLAVPLAFASLSPLSCHRTEEPPPISSARTSAVEPPPAPPAPVAPAQHSESEVKAPSSSSKADSQRTCIFPMPAEAPPRPKPAAQCPPDTESTPAELKRGYVRFPEAPGAPRVRVELAITPEEQQRGLMFRTHLADTEGMLFPGNEEHMRTFWMHNTCIPLDMIFISLDQMIVGVLENVPTLNEAPRAVPCPSAHVLEVNAGFTRIHGIRPGMKVEIEK